MLAPFAALQEDFLVEGWPLVRRGTAAVAAGLLNVSTDATHGLVALQVFGESTDPLALEGTRFELLGADAPAYFGEANGLPKPDRMDVAGGGRVFFVDLPPGDFQLRVTPPEGTCAGALGTGWPADAPNAFEVRVVEGHITALSVTCDAKGRDVRACDYVAQDCGEGQKCRYIGFESSNGRSGWGTERVPDGDRPLDAICERTGMTGEDDCQAGTVCVNFSRSPGTGRVCRAACLADSDCPADLECYGLRVRGPGNPTGGVCIPRCDPFDAMCPQGTACGVFTSHTPDELSQHPLCYRAGEVPLNGDCGEAVGAEGTCVRRGASEASACRAACDAASPCGAGQVCHFWDAPLDTIGFCYPEG